MMLLTTAFVFADIGFTREQSVQKYGSSTGNAKAGTTEIIFFETPSEKIEETYENGICVSSKVKPKATAYRRPTYQPTMQQSRPVPATAQTVTAAPRIQLTAPPPKPETTYSEAKPFGNMIKTIMPFAIILTAISFVIGMNIFLVKRVHETEPKEITSKEKIEALCNFMQKKYNDPLGIKYPKNQNGQTS
jgi:hypothetical protein